MLHAAKSPAGAGLGMVHVQDPSPVVGDCTLTSVASISASSLKVTQQDMMMGFKRSHVTSRVDSANTKAADFTSPLVTVPVTWGAV